MNLVGMTKMKNGKNGRMVAEKSAPQKIASKPKNVHTEKHRNDGIGRVKFDSERNSDLLSHIVALICDHKENNEVDSANEGDLLNEIMNLVDGSSASASGSSQKASEKQKSVKDDKVKHGVKAKKPKPESTEDETTSSESDDNRKGKTSKSKSKKLKSGLLDKAKSTKIERKVLFAHAMNSYGFMDEDLEFTDHEFNFNRLISGELEIISAEKIQKHEVSAGEKMSRLHILKKIAYYHGTLGLQKTKQLYKAYMCEYEENRLQWGDLQGIDNVEPILLFRVNNLNTVGKKDRKKDTKPSKSESSEEIVWCLNYNSGTCTYTDSHDGQFRGAKVKVIHTCV